jgi:hypothetical protein
MSNSYQIAARRRKFVYLGLIAALFVATIFTRGLVGGANAWTIQRQSDQLDLNEMSQGDVELTGSAIRLMLTGSRGVAVCGLWISATEKQKRHEWNQMELIVGSITKLQPHFVVPWLFQSWNLSYNVSVENDRLNDMYFYISRGINLLAEGETINRNNPDMRRQVAFFYQNKFTVSDKVTTLRCLFQLSCMPKDERDYRALRKGGHVDLDAFKAFCEKNPQLVRRLRETAIPSGRYGNGEEILDYLAKKPEDVVQFLKDNEAVPNRYRDDNPKALEERLQQFPVLPEPYRTQEDELSPVLPVGDGRASAVRAARAWYRYANEVIPPPNPEPSFGPTNYRDPERKRRMPKSGPTLIIFRQGPQRAQSFVAEQLAKDGWFDASPWIVDDRRVGADRWFKEDVRIRPTDNAQAEWELAYRMWNDHGRENGLLLEPSKLVEYRRRAELYARKRGFQVEAGQIPPPTADEAQDPVMADSIRANLALQAYNMNLMHTNYKYFLYQAEFEKAQDTVQARKLLYEAEQARKRSNDIDQAIKLYEQVLGSQKKMGLWGELIWKSNIRVSSDRLAERIAEETYEHQLKYLRLVQEAHKDELRKVPVAVGEIARLGGGGQFSPYSAVLGMLEVRQLAPSLRRTEPIWPPGPFDGLDPDGRPWIPDYLVDRVRQNKGLKTKPTQAPKNRKGPAPKGPAVPPLPAAGQ